MSLTVYKFEVIEGQEWIFPADEDDNETFHAMDGRVDPSAEAARG